MANAMPWSVRGIDPDIREQAVEAAHRSGLSVGQWLNQVLAGNLDEDEDEAPGLTDRSRPRGPRNAARKVEDLNQRLARIGRNARDTAGDRYPQEDDHSSQRMMGLLESAISAIERLETNPARSRLEVPPPAARGDELISAFRALEARVQALSNQQAVPFVQAPGFAQPAQPAPRVPFQRASRTNEDDPAFSAAIAEIEARRRELDAAGQNGGARAGMRPAAPVARREENRHLEEMRQQLDQLVTRIDDMRRDQKPESARLQDRMESLAARIDEWRARPNEDVALVRRDIASLGAAIETLAPNRLVGMVETAMTGIVEKAFRANRSELPERLLNAIADMQDDIRAVMREVASANGTDRVSHEIGIVARKLDEIGRASPDPGRVDDILRETDQIKSLIGQAMRAQPLEGLTHHLEALGRQIDTFKRDPANDGRDIIDAIRDVRDRVERIDPAATFAGIEQRLQAISAIETRLGALSGIEQKLDTIARDVSKIAKDAKPLPQLESIAARLERIDKVLDGGKKEPLAGLDQLATKLDRIGTTLEKASSTAPNDQLVSMLEQLSLRIEAAQSAKSDSGALDALQDEIAKIGRKLEEAAPGTPGLDGIERNVSDLIAQFDIARQDFRAGAAEAAEKAAREAIRTFARDESNDTLAAEGLLLLKRDLGEFKSQQGESERRTRQTLEAMHGTLEAVAARLGQIETQRPASPAQEPGPIQRAAQAHPAPAHPAPAQQQSSPAGAAAAATAALREQLIQREKGNSTPAASPAPQRDHAPVADDDFSDLPLEPGMQPGDERSLRGPAVDEPVLTADPRTNFIAAARRAAQAAAKQSHDALAAEEANRPKGLAGKLGSLLGRKPKAPKAAAGKPEMPAPAPASGARATREAIARGNAAAAAAEAPQSFLARQRRPILLGLAALIFAIGALKVLVNVGGSEDEDVAAPPMPNVQQERVLPPPPKPEVPADSKSDQRSEAQPRNSNAPADPRHTATVPGQASVPGPGTITATAPNGQQVVIPTLNQPQPANAKRAQRLGETPAISQADPVTVGSITPDGQARPLETGRDAIGDLIGQSQLKGQDRLREAALAGNAAAIFEIGSRHADGRGMPRDPKLAARWFEQAAAQGHGPSQYRLASLYREGRGVPKDAALAFQWFDRAAAQGHVLAMHNAAVLLAEGVHGAPDYAGAALWFKRAAEHGVKDSQFNVAILFARGLGVNQNLVESYRWFSAAAAQGDQDAVKKRDDIAARLTKEQLAKEKDWLKTFTPTKANPVANEAGNWETAARTGAPAQRTTRVN